jgi:hypothetical protein
VSDPVETEAFSLPAPRPKEFYADFRAALDAFVTESYVRNLLTGLRTSDSPFDAVFISKLTPDPITVADVSRVRAYANIRDLSDTLEFNDGWDD